jgi:hypothetical protein
MMAARGLTALEESARGGNLASLAAFALAVAGAVLGVAGWFLRLPAPLWIGGLLYASAGLAVFAALRKIVRPARIAGVLVALACVDLALADFRMIDPSPADPVSADSQSAADWLAARNLGDRVYSPSFSIPQLAAVQSGLRLLDGIDPLMLQSTVASVSAATGVPAQGYSVTLPTLATGNPAADNSGAIPDTALLRRLNVRYVVSVFEIDAAPLFLAGQSGDLLIYQNPQVMPRAWVARDIGSWEEAIPGQEARLETISPNRLIISAEGPGVLVLSEAAYPDWRATVDGLPAEIHTAGGWWRAVNIGPGTHTVEMWFDPTRSYAGLTLTLATLFALLGVWRWAK